MERAHALIGAAKAWKRMDAARLFSCVEAVHDMGYHGSIARAFLSSCETVADLESLGELSAQGEWNGFRVQLSSDIFREIAHLDPRRADELRRGGYGEGELGKGLLHDVAMGYGHTAVDAGFRWLETLERDELQVAISPFIISLGFAGDPTLALAAIESFEGTAGLDPAKRMIAEKIATRSAREAFALIESMNNKQQAKGALMTAAMRMAANRADLRPAVGPDSPLSPASRNLVVSSYLKHLPADRIADSLSYVDLISQPKNKEEAIKMLARTARALPEEEIRAIAESSEWSEEAKATFRAAIDERE